MENYHSKGLINQYLIELILITIFYLNKAVALSEQKQKSKFFLSQRKYYDYSAKFDQWERDVH
jgi:hypothetical protein